MKLFHTIIFLLLLQTLANSQSLAPKDTFRLIYIGGQSNMDGYGYNSELPDSLSYPANNVWIFHGNPAKDGATDGGLGIWAPLRKGHGVGFSSNGKTNKYSKRFGIELSLIHQLHQLYPDEKFAFIKYSRGGTSIDSNAAQHFGCWEPDFNGLNQYDHFLSTLRNAFQHNDINNDGKADYLLPAGIIWMQGESDADKGQDIAERYHDHLKRLMDLMRASLHNNDLPIVIGKISDSGNDSDGAVWDNMATVHKAQEEYCQNESNASIVRSTKNYEYSDKWHYNSEGFIDLGAQFAIALYKLRQE